ncbi:MAG: hypothetical protein V4633_13755 [Pseudomonadota bacterium]
MSKHEKLLDVLHGTAHDLHAAGTMDTTTKRKFVALCLAPLQEYSAAQVMRSRLRFNASRGRGQV